MEVELVAQRSKIICPSHTAGWRQSWQRACWEQGWLSCHIHSWGC